MFVNLTLAILLIGLAAFFPYLVERVDAWQKMHPRVRLHLRRAWQLFMILFAIQSLLSVAMDLGVITVATALKIGNWLQGLIVLTIVYICATTLHACRKINSQEIEKTREEKKRSR